MLCELCERPAGTAYLCPSCEQDTADRLRRLPALYTALGAMLAPGRTADGGRTAMASEAPLPVQTDVVDQRAEFVVLETWARAVAAGQGVPHPASRPAADDLGARVTAACAALRLSVWWIAASWPAAGDCAQEVRDLYDGARSVVGADDLPARMGRCPQLVHGQPCGAELLLPSGQQVLTCAWCGATYPPGIWAALKVAQRAVPEGAGAAQRPAAAGTTR